MKAASILGIVACLLTVTGGADASAQARVSKDYTWIINKLRADGLTPSGIQWSEIESMCLPLKSNAPDEYNECRYEKAKLQADFRDDSITCEDVGRAFNPNYLRYQAVVVEVPSNATSDMVTTMLNTTPAVADDQAFRRYLFSRCMAERGWKNPRDYRRGYSR